MQSEDRLRRLRFRAWHRGTREADYMIGGWALGTLDVPAEYRGALMDAFRKLDYVEIPH